MILKTVHVREFQSIRDSNELALGDVTCLVGKNEAGKSALLKALYRLNPIIEAEGSFSVTDDYPRSDVSDYEIDVDTKKRQPAVVVTAAFELDEADMNAIAEKVGEGVVKKRELTLSKGYENKVSFSIEVDIAKAIKNLIGDAVLLPDLRKAVETASQVLDAKAVLDAAEQTEGVQQVKARIDPLIAAGGVRPFVYREVLKERIPKFLYFDEYYQMQGKANIEALQQRMEEEDLFQSDYPLIGLIHLARLEIKDLLDAQKTRDLKNRLEGAGNHLTKNVVKYWSQNRHLELQFDVRPAKPQDPEDMRSGTNIWAEVRDSRHKVTTELGTRSRGFVWFFSFLAWYSDVKQREEPVVLLLDEPGLSLHAKAQEDLLRYFDAEIAGTHQLIYTTHSPFMVDPTRFDRVRIVQDLGIDSDEVLPAEKEGTKILADVLDATGDSLFPLQGALGYEIYQTLFIGPNSLVVEGVSDLLYLQGMTAILESLGRVGLSKEWIITPVGGAGKVPTFVALIGAQRGLNVAVLIDYQKKDQQLIDDLFKRKLLKKKNVATFADFTGAKEADIEDMFGEAFYLKLVNEEYGKALKAPIKVADLDKDLPRVIQKLEKYFSDNALGAFSHFRPARYFSEQLGKLQGDIPADSLNWFEAAAKQFNALLNVK